MTKWTTILLTILVACGQVSQNGPKAEDIDTAMANTHPKRFSKELTEEDKEILAHFQHRRAMFNDYLQSVGKNKETLTCPSCGYPTLSERMNYEICDICYWEDDGQDDKEADEVWGGPNQSLSLTESRLIIGHRLKALQDSLNGQLITNPETVLGILSNHRQTMNAMAEQLFDKDEDHPLFQEWIRKEEQLMHDLIDKE